MIQERPASTGRDPRERPLSPAAAGTTAEI
jgi:hypothetical protein